MEYFLLLPLLFYTSFAVSAPNDISIFHTPFSSSTTPSSSEFDSVQNSAQKDPARLAYLSSSLIQSKPTNVPVSSGLQFMQSNNYVLRAKFGTPGQLLFLALDTANDAAWVPCSDCVGCTPSNSSFAPSKSSTYKTVDCSSNWCPQFKGQECPTAAGPTGCWFNMTYGGESWLSGRLSQDLLRLALDIVPNYPFGCVSSVTKGETLPKQGLLGFGRGPAGLLAQSRSLYQGVFSYCLPSYKSYYFSGSLRLGATSQPKAIPTTPLYLNPHRSSLYYVKLISVSVGRVPVRVPPGSFDFNPQTGAGTIVDSGTVITRFVSPAYTAIRNEFRRQIKASNYSSLGAFDTCFETNGAGPVTPMITLHLEGLNLTLPVENTYIHSSARPLACLAMAAAPDNVNNVVNVIANYQQQNHRVLIDVVNSKVGFARELCS